MPQPNIEAQLIVADKTKITEYPFGDLLVDSLPLGVVFQNSQGEIEKANPAAERILGLSLAQLRGVQSIDPRWQAIHEDETPFPGEDHPAMVALKTLKPVQNVIMGIENPEREERTWISISAFPIPDGNSSVAGVYAVFKDITARIRAQKNEREADALFRSSIEVMTEGVAIHKVVYDNSGSPKDYVILGVNSSYEKQTGLAKQVVVGKLASEVYGTGAAPFLDIFAKVADTQQPTKFEQYFAPLQRHFLINVFSTKRGQFVTIFEDISDIKASAEALYQSEERLRAITDNVNAVMFMKDREGRYLHVNHHFETLFHLKKSQIIGKTDHEFLPSDLADSFVKNDRAVIQSGQPIEVEEYVPIGNEVRTFMSVKFPICNVSGEIYAISGVATDITERKKSELALQDSEARYRHFAEELPLGVLITQGGLTKYVNPALLKMIGYAEEELLEKPFIPFVFNEDQAWLIDLHRRRMMGEHIESPYVVRMVCKNGDIREWRMHTNTIVWNGKPSGLGITEDITEQMRTEKKLHESFLLLEEKEMAKTRFLAAAGHDLRQPLAAAHLFIDALKLAHPSPVQDQIIQRLDQAMSNFNELLDALLNVSKLDSGLIKPEYTVINLREISSWLNDSFTPLANEKGIAFRLFFPEDASLHIRGDFNLIKSVLMNLVSNALKFTTTGGALVSARKRGDTILFQVWDTGIGIPLEFNGNIYDEFYQVNNAQRDRTKGLGLGLSIVKRTIALFDSNITCRSTVGRGSVFEFRIPRIVGSVHSAQSSTPVITSEQLAPMQSIHGKRFVIIEDDMLLAEALGNALVDMGAEVLAYHCTEAALNQASASNDYYVVDYMLGGTLNGIQLLEQFQQKLGKPVNAVIMTGDTSREFVAKSAQCCWPVVYKPSNLAKLLLALNIK